jgi:putative CocE/NonD family hydrolase
MGIDEWRDETDWPLPDTSYTDFHLHSGGVSGDGSLSGKAAPTAVDGFVYDPADPVPTMGGRVGLPASRNQSGPVDQRPVESRSDVLVYSSGQLEDPVEITGHLTAVLFVSSSAVDTDFTVKVVDVFPDGKATYLTDGILRMRYRDSLAHATLMHAGTMHEVRVDVGVTSNVFLAGHRIRVEISSSNFPRYDRNPNTGDEPATATRWQVATNRVYLGATTPSRVIMPVIHR